MKTKDQHINFSGLEEFKSEDIVCMCPLTGVIDVISKKWALFIISTLGNKGKMRYSEIAKNFPVRPKGLTAILRDLEKNKLIRREVYPSVPLRVEYSLTKKGEELRELVIPLLKWAASNSTDGSATCPILNPKK